MTEQPSDSWSHWTYSQSTEEEKAYDEALSVRYGSDKSVSNRPEKEKLFIGEKILDYYFEIQYPTTI